MKKAHNQIRDEIRALIQQVVRTSVTTMLRDQTFTDKDLILLGTSFFAHPKYVIDYTLAHNYKMATVLHERASILLFVEHPLEQSTKVATALEAFGCPFGNRLEMMVQVKNSGGHFPADFLAFKAIYSKALKLDFARRKLLNTPMRPIWLNHDDFYAQRTNGDDSTHKVLQAMVDHYTFPGLSIF